MRGHAAPEIELEVDVGKVGDRAGGEQEHELDEERGRAEAGDHPGAIRIDRSAGQEHAPELRDRDEGADGGGGAHRLKEAGEDENAPDRPNEPSCRLLAFPAHESASG